MQYEGVIKFHSTRHSPELPGIDELRDLEHYRNKLFKLGWIGELEGIGYGNISSRIDSDKFIITCSQSQGLLDLEPQNYCTIIRFNIEKNEVSYDGLNEPSSEAMTHAAIYQACSEVNAIIHVHNKKIWESQSKDFAYTPIDAEYGSPALAYAIIDLFRHNNFEIKMDYSTEITSKKNRDIKKNIIIMNGHEDGVLAFGRNLEECFHCLKNSL